MLKFLLIILLIFGLIFLVVGVLFGKFLKFLRNPQGKSYKYEKPKPDKYKNDDVIYSKDDIVILKGESDKKKDKKDDG